MGFYIPNAADAAFVGQALPDSRDFDILAAAHNLTGVVSGCAVTAQGTPDMTLAVAAGAVLVGGVFAKVAAGNVTITTAHASLPRFDLVCVDNAGAKSVVAGTANSNPVFPDPAGKAVLAAVYVPANDTAIEANQVVDKRVLMTQPSRVLASDETTTTVVNTTAETNLFSLTLPGGLVVASDYLVIRAIGDKLNNSGASVNYTYRFKFGATTVMATGNLSSGSNANRKRWDAVFVIAMETTSAERIDATLHEGPASANTWDAPSSVVDGYGTATDDTASNQNCVMTVQMGTASVNADMRCHAAALMLMRNP